MFSLPFCFIFNIFLSPIYKRPLLPIIAHLFCMENKPSLPIGIFDSGIGGLTVARQLARLMPYEDMIYFGDTAHLPYGEKSTAAIQAYSVKICHFLLSRGVKAILIACNSASAAAYDLVKEYVGSKALVFNVIDPIVADLCLHYPNRTIGLIGTKKTVNSGVYQKKAAEICPDLRFKALATPLLAPMIEEGFFNNNISLHVIETYLKNPDLDGIDALVLACTHYPLISSQIEAFYNGRVKVIDPSLIVAQHVQQELEKKGLIHAPHLPERHFYVSDYTEAFENATQIFFSDKLSLEYFPIWD